jgi:hypothetical protein
VARYIPEKTRKWKPSLIGTEEIATALRAAAKAAGTLAESPLALGRAKFKNRDVLSKRARSHPAFAMAVTTGIVKINHTVTE